MLSGEQTRIDTWYSTSQTGATNYTLRLILYPSVKITSIYLEFPRGTPSAELADPVMFLTWITYHSGYVYDQPQVVEPR